eukprot:CAMPEP_0119342474 /NCGR_PEP_ID=MMETSP1333-20130426/104821_1 /TAXON_ID=418940 /ORGANISM="Scyphosphaera apsteinii, Strain RCC1455" /LENGTH=282 /DNA_ID=CAMNT_0007354699 /DNA_START=37 /DNA_END=885 /DNA_ORIENTATION=+
MARRGAARREKRHAKRVAARAERGDQKYAMQKGGINKKHKHAGFAQTSDDQVVVVRNGKPLRLGGASDEEERDCADSVPDGDGAAALEEIKWSRLNRTAKKVRALEKKLRQLEQLKARMRAGVELDAQQQAKLRQEAQVMLDLLHFKEELDKEKMEAPDVRQGIDQDEEEMEEGAQEQEQAQQEQEEVQLEQEVSLQTKVRRGESKSLAAAKVARVFDITTEAPIKSHVVEAPGKLKSSMKERQQAKAVKHQERLLRKASQIEEEEARKAARRAAGRTRPRT